jgi:hypothetical protein
MFPIIKLAMCKAFNVGMQDSGPRKPDWLSGKY